MNINIIIPFYKNEGTIDRLLKSIEEQDYKHYDVTIVFDGRQEEAQKNVIDAYFTPEGEANTPYALYLEQLDKQSGASAARNFGAKISGENLMSNNTDSILFFIDGDCELYPGILGIVAREFEKDKGLDFVYGDYRFENKFNYFAREYDPYLLKTMNYISTMSPIRRKSFNRVGGFKDVPYFQDWSLFYQLAKQGAKGKYLKRFFFTTKKPNEDNISGTKGKTLSEKAADFRKWNDIPDDDLVVTSYGADHQALQRAKMLNADYVGHNQAGQKIMPPNYGFDNWKATYMVGCYNQTPEQLANHFQACVGKPILHFIGTDIFQLYNLHPMSVLKEFSQAFKQAGATVFANSPRCLDEMRACGFSDAKLLYTPIYNMGQYSYKVDPPKDFTVAVYFSDDSPMMALDGGGGFSNLPLITDVARSMPTIKFKFFGGLAKHKPEDIEKDNIPNIEFCGRIKEEDMCDFINSCSMIVRSTIHDGFPQLPIQFLLCGRQALVSCPDEEMKYAEKISQEETYNKYDDIKKEIIDKIYTMAENPTVLKDEVENIHEYYSNLMSEETFVNTIRAEVPKDVN
jgi:glycosyltransferase involved in cell wall biosynthesis